MSYDESDYQRDLQEQAMEEMFQEWLPEALWERAAEAATQYLRTYGDSVYQRVLRALSDAKHLAATGHHEAAITRAFTAIELTIGHLLFRPLFLGVLLSEELANRIVQEILNGKGERERTLLPTVLKHWKIDLGHLIVGNGQSLWSVITDKIRKRRNAVIHEGASAALPDSELAISGAQMLLDEVVHPLADKLGFTLKESGKWSEIQLYSYMKTYATKSAFKEP